MQVPHIPELIGQVYFEQGPQESMTAGVHPVINCPLYVRGSKQFSICTPILVGVSEIK